MHSCGDPLHDFFANLPLFLPLAAPFLLAFRSIRARIAHRLGIGHKHGKGCQ